MDHDYLFLQQFTGVDFKFESLGNFLMDLEPYDIYLAQFYSMDLKPEPFVTILLDRQRCHLLFEFSNRMGDKFEPNGSLFRYMDLHDQQLPRVLVLGNIH